MVFVLSPIMGLISGMTCHVISDIEPLSPFIFQTQVNNPPHLLALWLKSDASPVCVDVCVGWWWWWLGVYVCVCAWIFIRLSLCDVAQTPFQFCWSSMTSLMNILRSGPCSRGNFPFSYGWFVCLARSTQFWQWFLSSSEELIASPQSLACVPDLKHSNFATVTSNT